jgi:glycogen operon protein
LLLDPYGRGAVVPENYSRNAILTKGEDMAAAIRSIIVEPDAYDWEGDVPLKRHSSRVE